MGKFVDAYRPELHYMRGPGPKWHAKHTAALSAAAAAQPIVSRPAAGESFITLHSGMLGWAASSIAAATLGVMAVIVLA